jgi:nucleotide-binding universal stress UspA family protein
MKVIVGVDGSAGSWAAVTLAGRLLSADRDQLLLYNSPAPLHVKGLQRADADALQRARAALADAVFDKATEHLDPTWAPRIQRIHGEQKPAHGLLMAAEEQRAELIAVGARGIGPLESILVGSVSRAVALHASAAVLIVRPPVHDAGPLRVLMACDGTETSSRAGEVLKRLDWPDGSVGKIVTVLESRVVGQVPDWLEQQARDSQTDLLARAWVEQHDHQRQERCDQLRQFCQEHLPAIFQNQPPLVRDGHAAQQILHAIRDEQIDLVVCGARNQSLWRQLLLGSTSHHLLNHAHCSVLIVRQHEKP